MPGENGRTPPAHPAEGVRNTSNATDQATSEITYNGTATLGVLTSDDLEVARELAAAGIPIFLAQPATDAAGHWIPKGGSGVTGYWLPTGWQQTRADPGVLDAYVPGMAVCAVMGHGLDLLDVDPRSGGDATAAGLRQAGIWPTSYAEASTPSGGSHTFVAGLHVGSRDGAARGLDVKAGDRQGQGRGFAFIAPTRRASKTTGAIKPYTWTCRPDLARLAEDGPTDNSGLHIAEMVAAVRNTTNGTSNGTRATATELIAAALTDPFAPTGVLSNLPALIASHPRHVVGHKTASALRGRGGWREDDALAFLTAVVWPQLDQTRGGHPYPLNELARDVHDAFNRYPDGPSTSSRISVPAGDPAADIVRTMGAEFFAARSELAHILEYAHARLCSPWAVLGVVLGRVACTVPPNVRLPPIVGGDGSLNLSVALSGPSGSGKSASISAGAGATTAGGFPTIPIGSGEGISRSFAFRHKDGHVHWIERSILFTATEVDALAALSGRQGATLGGQLREMFNGGELGFGYAAAEKRIILPDHSYRACLILGVQPGRAGALLDDADGGTPQRFLWMPSTDPGIPRHPAPSPPPWTLPPLIWRRSIDALATTGVQLAPREQIDVDLVAVEAIQEAAHARATGLGDPLDGHALLVRLKVAAALGVLAGRKMVSADDWRLAGMVMAVSDATRSAVARGLAASRAAAGERAGHVEGVRQATAEHAKAELDALRVTTMIRRKMSTPGVKWSRSALRKTFSNPDRSTFDAVFFDLFSGGIQ